MIKKSIFPLIAVLFLGCASTDQKTVVVKGEDPDLMDIAGNWYGVYEAEGAGRKGTLNFTLYRGTRIAEGQVIMSAGDPDQATPLAIKFISAGSNKIRGEIGPYKAPDGQEILSVFHGTVKGDRVEGRFVTKTVEGVEVQQGKWRAVRK